MTDYHELTLSEIADLARKSSGELGSLADGAIVDYETGIYYRVPDEDTALFLASARPIVLELIRRINEEST